MERRANARRSFFIIMCFRNLFVHNNRKYLYKTTKK